MTGPQGAEQGHGASPALAPHLARGRRETIFRALFPVDDQHCGVSLTSRVIGLERVSAF